MKCVADENVDAVIVSRLRKQGVDVWYVAEAAPGITDDEVLARAAEDDALLLTSARTSES